MKWARGVVDAAMDKQSNWHTLPTSGERTAPPSDQSLQCLIDTSPIRNHDVQMDADITAAEPCAGLLAGDDSENKQDETNNSRSNPAVTLHVALCSLNVYPKAAGCTSYEQFYSLFDQVYEISRLQVAVPVQAGHQGVCPHKKNWPPVRGCGQFYS